MYGNEPTNEKAILSSFLPMHPNEFWLRRHDTARAFSNTGGRRIRGAMTGRTRGGECGDASHGGNHNAVITRDTSFIGQ